MVLVLAYSSLLIFGIISSQVLDFTTAHGLLAALTNTCLAYIMMEVGLEFVIDKTRLKSYGLDFLFAFLAAALPWIFCAVYFMSILRTSWQESFLIGVFAAPTSAGILFAMLAAAGLGTSWLFRKAQVLAVFDDFVAILLLIPLQIIFIGFKPGLLLAVFFMIIFLVLAFRWLHTLSIPTDKYWLLAYGIAIVVIQHLVYQKTRMDFGILLPAFAFGTILYNPHLHKKKDLSYDKIHQEPVKARFLVMDRFIKGFFMFLVGCSLPKMQFVDVGVAIFIGHVLALTLLSNLGKCFLFFCYRKEASWKNRLALSIAMFPRGEVGAGVLLIAMGYGLGGLAVSLSILSLALNLVLTGAFIALVIWLGQPQKVASK